ncbi:hypothetical protein L1049_023656 [Liquidambar formosana]|uniref:F-box associated domain-containing protein n=1 Tax=Liquidambar formosana TaxID=63359 RepID=A0AAP0X3P8_LIQFO
MDQCWCSQCFLEPSFMGVTNKPSQIRSIKEDLPNLTGPLDSLGTSKEVFDPFNRQARGGSTVDTAGKRGGLHFPQMPTNASGGQIIGESIHGPKEGHLVEPIVDTSGYQLGLAQDATSGAALTTRLNEWSCPLVCILSRSYVVSGFYNEAVHWVGYHSRIPDENLILTFDVGDEVFGEMMLPTNLVCQWDTTIAVCRGMLSVFQYDEHSGIYSSSYRCSIWVMNEYGVAESWTKQFSIDTQEGIWDTIGVWETIGLRQAIRKIISLRKDGEILLQTSDGVRGKLVSYNPETKRINVIGICSGTRDSFHVDTYMESLVLLKGVNGVLGSQAEPDAITPVLLGGNDGVERTKETVEGKEE